MITKGIVECILDSFHVKVRIPIFDRISSSSLCTDAHNLNDALICCLPNCNVNMQIGDIVFVGFEDNDFSRPIVLGYLYRSNMTESYCDMIFNGLKVNIDATLPANTSIGSVTPSEIESLKGIQENIQWKFDCMSQSIEELKTLISGLQN